jgi:BirA family transcriptional regulator, biotin operon repressor / biotin---[acetyl-CoA-carboxylase] ligase
MKVLTFPSLDSTNNYLKEHADHLDHGTIIRALHQTAGRGQFLRTWQSNPNENLLVSFLFKHIQDPLTIKQLEHIIMEAVGQIFAQNGFNVSIKLPNDLYVQDKKIAGMLIETKREGDHFAYVIIGIGININQTSFLDLPNATSLAILSQRHYDIESIFQAFLEACSPIKAF